jgi:hypothetical protein
MKLLMTQFCPDYYCNALSLLASDILLCTLFSNTLNLRR